MVRYTLAPKLARLGSREEFIPAATKGIVERCPVMYSPGRNARMVPEEFSITLFMNKAEKLGARFR